MSGRAAKVGHVLEIAGLRAGVSGKEILRCHCFFQQFGFLVLGFAKLLHDLRAKVLVNANRLQLSFSDF